MVGTFSYNIGSNTEAISYPVQDYLDDLLDKLLDNEDKLILPIDLRNAILSLWSSIPFKETTNNYIGVDSNNPSDRELRRTIYIGKRSYLNTDIMTAALLDSDVDLFLYNTKLDSISNNATKISFLYGKTPTLNSPYIQSEVVSGVTPSLSLDIVNTNGIDFSSGTTVSINNIPFYGISNNQTLIKNGSLVEWGELTQSLTDYIGVTGSELTIVGDKININDYPIEFSDTRYITYEGGSIKEGMKYDKKSVVEILRAMIYTEIKPTCTLTIDNKYAEYGSSPTPILTWVINKETYNLQRTTLFNMKPGFVNPIIDINSKQITGTATGLIGSFTASTTFKITVKDEQNNTAVATQTITPILPYLYGFTGDFKVTNLTKLIEPKTDKEIALYGSGDFYFAYDSGYGLLSGVIDESLVNHVGSLTYSYQTLSYGNLWRKKQYLVYKWSGLDEINPSVNFKFTY